MPYPTTMGASSGPQRAKHALVSGLVIVALIGLSACGATAKAADSGTKGTGSKPGLAEAKAVLAKARQRPTEIPETTPVGKPIPKGKRVAFIACGASACNQEGALLKTYTDKLGWDLTVLNNDGTPESARAAFAQVVREKYDAVIYNSVPRDQFASFIPALKSNGTFVAGMCVSESAGNGIDFTNCVPDQVGQMGTVMAAWATATTDGDTDAAFVNISAFPTIVAIQNQFEKSMKTFCPTCGVDAIDIPVTALGVDVPQRLVAYLRSHPKVKRLALGLDQLGTGLPAALKAAGLTDVQFMAEGGEPTNLQYIATGDQSATLAFAYYEVLLSELDAVVRHEAGVPLLPPGYPDMWLLEKKTAPQTDKLFPIVEDVASKYETMWGIS